jgi:signal transduction histidine kinase
MTSGTFEAGPYRENAAVPHSATLSTLQLFRQLCLVATGLMTVAGLLSLWNEPAQTQVGGSLWIPLPWLADVVAQAWASAHLAPAPEGASAPWWFIGVYSALSLGFLWLTGVCGWRSMDGAGHVPAASMLVRMGIAFFLDPWVSPGLFYLTAVELACCYPIAKALRMLALQMLLAGMSVMAGAWSDVLTVVCDGVDAVSDSALWLAGLNALESCAFQAFVFVVGLVAHSEMRARKELTILHRNLSLAQVHLSEAVATAERNRISTQIDASIREHLVALEAHANASIGLLEGAALDAARTVQSLVGQLQAEVATLGESQPASGELRQALLVLQKNIPTPRIVLDVDPGLSIASHALNHAIFRMVQEATSNAVRHAEADTLSIQISQSGNGITVRIQDDGRGTMGIDRNSFGSGLKGIMERVEAFGGTLVVATPTGGGFMLSAHYPSPEGFNE